MTSSDVKKQESSNTETPSGRILVVDDEPSLCELLEVILEKDGYDVHTATRGEDALELFGKNDFDVVLQDIKMKEVSGIDLLTEYREKDPDCNVIIITAYSTWESAVKAMRRGAFDYFRKPFDNEEIREGVKQAINSRNYERDRASDEEPLVENLIGDSEAIKDVRNTINRVAPTNVTVLITGESGTGKELVARTIHMLSPRRDCPFMTVNCGAFPENLLESELFGHKKGAFTGAQEDKRGILEGADGGTLFLDEIAEMPEEMQVKLLRVLEEQEFKPVGGVENKTVDLRFIAATNKDIEERVVGGQFREDLYYRLNVVNINVPPLRERGDDIFLLAGHFLNESADEAGKEIREFSEDARDRLKKYSWPGNVRELENAVQRAVALAEEKVIDADLLFENTGNIPSTSSPSSSLELPDGGLDIEKRLKEIEKDYIQQALDRTEGNIKKASSLLGLSYRSLRYKIDKYELDNSGD